MIEEELIVQENETSGEGALAPSHARLTISNILSSLQKEGIIQFREFYQNKIMENGNEVTIPLLELQYVAKKVDEFKK